MKAGLSLPARSTDLSRLRARMILCPFLWPCTAPLHGRTHTHPYPQGHIPKLRCTWLAVPSWAPLQGNPQPLQAEQAAHGEMMSRSAYFSPWDIWGPA